MARAGGRTRRQWRGAAGRTRCEGGPRRRPARGPDGVETLGDGPRSPHARERQSIAGAEEAAGKPKKPPPAARRDRDAHRLRNARRRRRLIRGGPSAPRPVAKSATSFAHRRAVQTRRPGTAEIARRVAKYARKRTARAQAVHACASSVCAAPPSMADRECRPSPSAASYGEVKVVYNEATRSRLGRRRGRARRSNPVGQGPRHRRRRSRCAHCDHAPFKRISGAAESDQQMRRSASSSWRVAVVAEEEDGAIECPRRRRA